jgi:hypothetical protein
MKWFCIGATTCIVATFVATQLGAQDYEPVGPDETVALEKGLADVLGSSVPGIWPSTTRLKQAVPADELPKPLCDRIEAWFWRMLNPQLKPGRPSTSEWMGLRALHWKYNFILGKWRVPSLDATVEFQAFTGGIGILVTSKTLLDKQSADLTDAEVREAARKILDFPEEKFDKIEVEKKVKEITGVTVCYGVMRCEFNERTSDYKRVEWWSYIPFWITRDKIFVDVSCENEPTPVLIQPPGWEF